MEQFTVQEGDVVTKRRMEIVHEEYSNSITKGYVIKPIQMGYELKGNVIRMAKVVASLGSEQEEEEEEKDSGSGSGEEEEKEVAAVEEDISEEEEGGSD